MRILIIGGTGFIGPHVVRRLAAQGHEITAFHRGRTEVDLPPRVVHMHGDRADLGADRGEFARLAPEVVLDTRPLAEDQARVLASAVRGIARRIVALSSGDVYRAYGILRRLEAGPPERVPIAEDAPLRRRLYPYRGEAPRAPDDPMRWADDYDKILVERVLMNEADVPSTILRLPMVYGPGDDGHRLHPYLKRMDDGRPAILLGEARAGWRWARGYVEDIAAAIVAAVLDDRASGRIYNVGEPDALTEAEWVRTIGRAAGWSGWIRVVPDERLPSGLRLPLNFEQHLVYDTTRIRQELGYEETLSREEATRQTVDWERSHPPAQIAPQEFDYAAEDNVLANLAASAD